MKVHRKCFILCHFWLLVIYQQFLRLQRCNTKWMNNCLFHHFISELECTLVVVISFVGSERGIWKGKIWTGQPYNSYHYTVTCFSLLKLDTPKNQGMERHLQPFVTPPYCFCILIDLILKIKLAQFITVRIPYLQGPNHANPVQIFKIVFCRVSHFRILCTFSTISKIE